MSLGPLWEATRDLHHACEAHPVGAAMATGKPPAHWYAAWVQALLRIHTRLDPSLPLVVHRCAGLQADLDALGIDVPESAAALAYADTLTDEVALAGAGYVLTGAHLMGGEIMRRRLEGYPTRHLVWEDRKAALAELGLLRQRPDIVAAARACFGGLLAIMDEIHARDLQDQDGSQAA
jgi:hypothetical protein